jgi:hypothetical protein
MSDDNSIPPAQMPERGRPGFKVQVALALLAFAAGLAAMAWAMTQWNGSSVQKAPAPPVATLNGALEPATQPTAPLTPPPAAPGVQSGGVSATGDIALARLGEFEQRMARLTVEAQTASNFANRAEAMMTAFAARRALDAGAPLGYLEGQLRVIFGEGQPKAVATIINAAREPVTVPMLRQKLEGLRAAMLRGDPRAGWWEGMMQGLGNLAVVRRADAPTPEPEQRLADARLAVESGQMDEAIRQVSALPARPEMATWLELARRYNEARRALEVIEAAAVIEPRAVVPAPL